MKRCALFLSAGLVLASVAAAQEPERYPYETESEERTPMLLTDSVLFYRAVQSAADLYDEITGYNLSFVRTQRRGQEYGLRAISVEGLELSSRHFTPLRALGASESGSAGLEPAEDHLGLTNGMRIFRFSDGEPLPSGRASVGFTDRNYLFGAKLSYAGPLGRSWNFSAAADIRTGRDMHVEGVFTNAATVALRAEKRMRNGHRLALFAILPPSMRGVRSASTDEAFTLTGDRLYNPAWGFQNGRVRNSHVRREFLPLAVAIGNFSLSAITSLVVSLGVEAGVSKYSTLGWYDARTPLPDNYRYMPSYTGDRETDEAWRMNDPRYTQIDWDELYAENRMADGQAVYALEDRVERICRMQFNTNFTTRFDERLTLCYGVLVHYNTVRNYKQLRDLLGADYLADIDYYLVDDDTYGNDFQNDLRHPNRRVREGGRFGYDYAMRCVDVGVRVLMQYRADRFRADVGAEVRDASVRRRGYFEKELFSGARSYGHSAVQRFTPYTFKISAGWAFSPKSYLGAAVTTAATTPEADALFLQPQYNNRTTDDPSLRRLWAAELTYTYTSRAIDLRAAAFVVSSREGMETFRYFDDLAGAFCDMSVVGIGIRSYGIEAAANIRLSYRWRLSLAASAGRYEYSADPRVTIVTDADNTPVDVNAVSQMGGCRIGNAPQLTGCAELGYFGPKGWGFRAAVNYVGARFVEPAFLRRTERVVQQAAPTPEAFAAFTEQERLGDAFTLDASAFRTFYFGDSRLTISLMLRNLLGDRKMVYGAYEPLRVHRLRSGDFYAYAPFENRRTYAYPRSFYLSVSYRF